MKIKLTNILLEQVQETFFEDFKSWWIEKRNNDEDPIDIKFDLPHNEGDFQRSLRDAVDVGTDIFYILAKLWEMWGIDSDNEQLLNTIQDRNEFGKNLFYIMRKKDFIFDKEAKGAKTAVDRQDRDKFEKEYPEIGLNELTKGKLKSMIKKHISLKEEVRLLMKEQGYPWDPLNPGDTNYDTSYLCPNGGDLAGSGLDTLDNTNSVYHIFEFICSPVNVGVKQIWSLGGTNFPDDLIPGSQNLYDAISSTVGFGGESLIPGTIFSVQGTSSLYCIRYHGSITRMEALLQGYISYQCYNSELEENNGWYTVQGASYMIWPSLNSATWLGNGTDIGMGIMYGDNLFVPGGDAINQAQEDGANINDPNARCLVSLCPCIPCEGPDCCPETGGMPVISTSFDNPPSSIADTLSIPSTSPIRPPKDPVKDRMKKLAGI